MTRVPIRIRVALAFAVVMAVVLAGAGLAIYLLAEDDLDGQIEHDLGTRAADVAALARIPERERLAQVLSPDGRVVRGRPRAPLLRASELALARRHRIVLDRDETTRLLAEPAGPTDVVVVGESLHDREHALESVAAALLVGGPLALLLASAAGYALAAAALRPVEAMRRRAATAADPRARLPVPEARDEVRRLGETLNEMLARIERGVDRERTFVADASHELRTPLAILRTELDLALRQGDGDGDLRAALASAAEETERLAVLVDDLLLLARADHDALAVAVEPVDAREVLDDVARRFPGVDVDAPARLPVAADAQRASQALANLVQNALDHGAGRVTLSARAVDGSVELHVADEGAGFPAEFVPRAFDRFSRADTGRTGGGTGLGLAIARALAEAQGGTAGVRNRDGGGADAWVSLPRA